MSQRGIGLIGCGQFGFATICYYLKKTNCARLATVYDPNHSAASSLARMHGGPIIADRPQDVLEAIDVPIIFIASNHATHADYAISALSAGKDVYVEKPVAVNKDQLRALCISARLSAGKIYAGYNRPHSAAIRKLRANLTKADTPLSLACFVSAHKLSPEHWYRAPDEGTRICGNAGHWIDLAVHMLCWGKLPDRWLLRAVWSDENARDEDLTLVLVSERGDMVTIVLTARTEPFEGIRETIEIQWGSTIAQIDDFRRLRVWDGARKATWRFWPKDVGHAAAIAQPFGGPSRPWREVELSTLLMLRVAKMVTDRESEANFSFATAWAELGVPGDLK
jgi:predicted dehydrogenase